MRVGMTFLVTAVLAATFFVSGCGTAKQPAAGEGNGGSAPPLDQAERAPYTGGFVTAMEDGRMWIFRSGSAELDEYRKAGDLPKRVTRVRGGPGGITVLAPDFETIDDFMARGGAAASAAVPASVSASAAAGPRVVVRPPVAPGRPTLPTGRFAKPGYQTVEKDGRLWVFPAGSPDLAGFLAGEEPAKNVTLVRAGPAGMTLKGIESDHLHGYVAARPGFATRIADGRIWVFRPGSKGLASFEQTGEPAKQVIRPGAGPMGMTVKSEDFDTIDEYLCSRPGFVTRVRDGRLWVFRPGSKSLAEFDAVGEPAKHVTKVREGPHGMTIKAEDVSTIEQYMATAEGFETKVVDGRVWVFLADSKEYREFMEKGEPAKHITLVRAGPMGMTVKGPDSDTVNLYLRQVNQ